jgi:hypothetical protein
LRSLQGIVQGFEGKTIPVIIFACGTIGAENGRAGYDVMIFVRHGHLVSRAGPAVKYSSIGRIRKLMLLALVTYGHTQEALNAAVDDVGENEGGACSW